MSENEKHHGELIPNQNAEEYFAVPSASNTMLGHLKKSPAHLQWALAHPPKATPAMTLGSAFHACVLEGPKFLDEWARGSELSGRTKEGRAAKAELEEQYDADKILKPFDYDNVLAMAGAVFDHPVARALMAGAKMEVSAYWSDIESGINTKGRIDIMPPRSSEYGNCLVDLKSTIVASPEHMAKAVFNFGYSRQGGLYLSPFEERDRFVIIACEKSPPWAVGIYELSSDAVTRGWQEAQELLAMWARCLEDYDMDDLWPSYSEEIIELDLPPWAY